MPSGGDEGQDDGVEDLLDRGAGKGLVRAGEFGADEVEGQRSEAWRERVQIRLAAVGGPLPDLIEAPGPQRSVRPSRRTG
jgi:hypothetical protein